MSISTYQLVSVFTLKCLFIKNNRYWDEEVNTKMAENYFKGNRQYFGRLICTPNFK